MRVSLSRKTSFVALPAIGAFFLLLAVSRGAVSPANDPMARVKQGIGEVVALFQNQNMTLKERREKLRAMASGYFDFEDMARSALGYHWRDLTPAQRAEFVPVFTAFIQDAYLSKLQDYSVQKVQSEAKAAKVDYVSESYEGADYAEVFTKVFLPDQKDAVQVNYLLHQRAGVWRVYDLTIDAISVIANYRNQFNRVINNEGYDKLVADLRAKQQQFLGYMEHPHAQAASH
jgi:phospholipid transport system substrate-binding protein